MVTAHDFPLNMQGSGGWKETEPVPLCEKSTVPVGLKPVTLALHVMTVGEPATADVGVHETVVLVLWHGTIPGAQVLVVEVVVVRHPMTEEAGSQVVVVVVGQPTAEEAGSQVVVVVVVVGQPAAKAEGVHVVVVVVVVVVVQITPLAGLHVVVVELVVVVVQGRPAELHGAVEVVVVGQPAEAEGVQVVVVGAT